MVPIPCPWFRIAGKVFFPAGLRIAHLWFMSRLQVQLSLARFPEVIFDGFQFQEERRKFYLGMFRTIYRISTLAGNCFSGGLMARFRSRIRERYRHWSRCPLT